MKTLVTRIISGTLSFINDRKRGIANRFLASSGVNPYISYSHNENGSLAPDQAKRLLTEGHILVPNVSGFYHGMLVRYFKQYGLGNKCLLVSETKAVGLAFTRQFPPTHFVTTDFYLDLQPEPKCDVVWDLCSPSPPASLSNFNSVVCQATLEHVIDPMQVLRNLAAILNKDGHLFLQTHTPGFKYHPYPRDYLRYQPDWFEDVSKHIPHLSLIELLCVDGHAFAVYKRSESPMHTSPRI